MEEKINIAAILKDKPNGLRLYSPIFGECTFCYVREDTNDICVKKHNGVIEYFNHEGLYFALGEVMLFPSKEMRDFSKFAWKKNDILVNSSGFKLFFDRWANDDYTRFFGKVNILEDSFSYETEKYTLAAKEETIDTLKIENPEFKDGDIAFADYGNRQDVFIVSDKTDLSEGYRSFISLDLNSLTLSIGCRTTFFKKDLCKLRIATEEEKRQLFSALEKEGKAWDAEKKAIVDLKPKCEFKPFDRCIWKIRNCEGSIWRASFVSYVDEYGATPMDVSIDEDLVNLIILPYNDQTKLLVGTTDEWEGGEQ